MDDSPETIKKKGVYLPLRCSCAVLFCIFFFFFLLLSMVVLILAVLMGDLSISSSISVPSQCKIVSSNVDLRSSKVCELGFLNYKAKHVFYPNEKKFFRCRYDYYWASVFKVQYIDHSGQAQLALAEAPDEALPPDCRPNFGAAWLAKDKFKVNETYDCWYTLDLSKVNLHDGSIFDCQAKDPSTAEMLRRYSVLSSRILMSWFASGLRPRWRWEVVAGAFMGFSTPIISIIFIRVLQQLICPLLRIFVARMYPLAFYAIHLKRACFLLAYFSFVGWLTIQYGRRLGLSEILRVH